jgi:hypothetical protein
VAVNPRLKIAEIGEPAIVNQTEYREQGLRFYPNAQTTTTAALSSATNEINTSDDKVQGFRVYNTTNDEMYFATGANATSVWKCFDTARAAAITPS